MKQQVIDQLNNINLNFYKKVSKYFDSSRSYYWDGWHKLLEIFSPNGEKISIADIACGNGRFGNFLFENIGSNTISKYNGFDSDEALLSAAREQLDKYQDHLALRQIDLVNNNISNLTHNSYDLVVAFGFTHHIPSYNLRKQKIFEMYTLVNAKGTLCFSVWDFILSPRYTKRLISPASVNINPDNLEVEDYLLDWQRGTNAIRYCHYSSCEEIDKILDELAIPPENIQMYYADGRGGKLNRYYVITKK